MLPLLLNACSKKSSNLQQVKPIFVKIEAASKQVLDQEFETAGEIKADKEILLCAERQGQIEKIFVTEGKWVKKGDPLVKIKGDDIQADYKIAKADYQTFYKLYEQGAIAYQDLLRYETQLKKVEAQQNNLLIRAISDGNIGVIYVDPGDYVLLGGKILDLVKNYPLRLSYYVPEKFISQIKLGQRVFLESDNKEKAEAQIDFIAPRIDPQTRGLLLRAKILAHPNLKANQFVNIKQILSSSEVLMIREEAIVLEQGQEFVYLAKAMDKPDSTGAEYLAERINVRTGDRKSGFVEVLEGLKQGDLIVYAGLTNIYPGAKLIKVE